MLNIDQIKRRLPHHAPNKHPQRHIFKRSSVAICLHEGSKGLELLMIKRAERIGDPWSGQMGFPGGRMEQHDANILATAMRECQEEIGVDIAPHSTYIHRLDDIHATGAGRVMPLVVTPFVFHLHTIPDFHPNEEVAEIAWIPLELFRQPGKRKYFEIHHQDIDHALPCFMYRGFMIWGMSLRMIEELIRNAARD